VNSWKPIAAAAVIFAAGLGSGVLGAQLYRQYQRPPGPVVPGGPPMPGAAERMELLRRWAGRLDLTRDQRERVDALVHQSQQRVRELWEPVAPKAREELRELRHQIEAELTPEQRTRFETLAKEHPRQPQDHRRRRDGQTNTLSSPAPGSNSLSDPPPGPR